MTKRFALAAWLGLCVVVLAVTAIACQGQGAITQDKYSDRAAAAAKDLQALDSRLQTECGYTADSLAEWLRETDTYTEALLRQFEDIEQELDDLRQQEGIQLPANFNILDERLPDEDYAKMAPLLADFLNAFEVLVDRVIELADLRGCVDYDTLLDN